MTFNHVRDINRLKDAKRGVVRATPLSADRRRVRNAALAMSRADERNRPRRPIIFSGCVGVRGERRLERKTC